MENCSQNNDFNNQPELISAQNDIENIYNLKRNDYESDLNEGEIKEIKFYKQLFEDIAQDFGAYKFKRVLYYI